jgi:hypothetical protein
LYLLKDDKDLVHEFVNNQGLQCLVKIGGAADQNYQNYILRGRERSFHLTTKNYFFYSTWSINALC